MAETPDKDSRIDALQRRLDSREKEDFSVDRSGFREPTNSIPEDWEHEHDSTMKHARQKTVTKRSFARVFLVASLVFFVAAIAIGAFFVFRGGNVISSNNVDIALTGPATVAGGDTLTLDIVVTNRNNTTLEVVDLIVAFADGTRDPEDVGIEQKRIRRSLGDIRSGSRAEERVAGVVFGSTGEEQEVIVTVEYRVAGSNAIFVKDRLYTYELSSAPLSLRVEVPEETNSGQDITAVVTITSNTEEVLEHIVFEALYPFGFTFNEASPEPTFGDTVWVVGDIPPGGRHTIEIRGALEGQDGEERTFQFTSGIQDETDEEDISVAFVTTQETVVIARPFIALDVAVNGAAGETVVAGGDSAVRTDITWTNNLATPIRDAVVRATITGEAFDESSVSTLSGFYNSANNTITWNRQTAPDLARIDPGQAQRMSFTFVTKELATLTRAHAPSVHIELSVEGERFDSSDATGSVRAEAAREVQLASDLLLTSRGVYSVGPFANTGPLPPEVEIPTTYTILWTVTNSASEVRNAEVRATLPSYVSWLDVIAPSDEDVTFNDVGGEIVWNVGTVIAGAGYSAPPHEVALHVQLTPSLSQVSTSPIIVGQARVLGTDTFTGTTVGDTSGTLTTRITTDPIYSEGMGAVVE